MPARIINKLPVKQRGITGQYSEFHKMAEKLKQGQYLEIPCDNFAEAGRVAGHFRHYKDRFGYLIRVINHNVYISREEATNGK